jgi:hypothetical protein
MRASRAACVLAGSLCGHHRVDKPHQMLTDALEADALHAGLRALEQKIEFVRRKVRILKPHFAAELEDSLMLVEPMLVDHAPSRMIGLR